MTFDHLPIANNSLFRCFEPQMLENEVETIEFQQVECNTLSIHFGN